MILYCGAGGTVAGRNLIKTYANQEEVDKNLALICHFMYVYWLKSENNVRADRHPQPRSL
jgi:hypothetical protein